MLSRKIELNKSKIEISEKNSLEILQDISIIKNELKEIKTSINELKKQFMSLTIIE